MANVTLVVLIKAKKNKTALARDSGLLVGLQRKQFLCIGQEKGFADNERKSSNRRVLLGLSLGYAAL